MKLREAERGSVCQRLKYYVSRREDWNVFTYYNTLYFLGPLKYLRSQNFWLMNKTRV